VKQIEPVQRCALYIILGDNSVSPDNVLDILECENPDEGRVKLYANFATLKETQIQVMVL
jgi:hypothetical protein